MRDQSRLHQTLPLSLTNQRRTSADRSHSFVTLQRRSRCDASTVPFLSARPLTPPTFTSARHLVISPIQSTDLTPLLVRPRKIHQRPTLTALPTHHRSQPHLLGFHPILMQESMTFKSTSTSGTTSSKASSLFDLDENSNKSILVYKYRSGADGLECTTQGALCTELDKRELPNAHHQLVDTV